jgi:N-hydroxyarylamine O-acetyltransferase
MCHYHQTSPDSVFTRMTLATIATPRGRVSLMGRQLTVTCGGGERKSELTSEAEISQCLHREFGIELEQLPQALTSSST